MPEKNRDQRKDSETSPGREERPHRFINEKIVRQPLSKMQIARRILLSAVCAAVFGVVAAVCFVLAQPAARHLFWKETQGQGIQHITIPQDEPETAPAPSETAAVLESTDEETEPIGDLVRSEMENYQYSIKDLESLSSALQSVALKADKAVVSVNSIRRQTDWFDNPIETTGQYAGLVIARTDTEAVILTPAAAVQADSLEVVFQEGFQASGSLKQMDSVTGLATVSVDLSQISPEQAERLSVIELGNSYITEQGDLAISVGAPAGAVHSYGYGTISYIYKNVQMVDRSSRLMVVDALSNAQMGTFVLNTSGQLIGWASIPDSSEAGNTGSASVLTAISDYKGILEDLTNGIATPYLGVRGQEVSAAMEETGLPRGIYVTESLTDGPAYNAGIQNGDIIVAINGMDVPTMKEFRKQLESLTAGTQVNMTVQRNGKDAYTAIEFLVTIGSR